MIPDSILSRLDPERERQTISIGPAEFQTLKKDDTVVTHGYRIVLLDVEELRHSGSLPSSVTRMLKVEELNPDFNSLPRLFATSTVHTFLDNMALDASEAFLDLQNG